MDCYIEYQNNVNKKYRVGNTRYWFFLRLNYLEEEIYTYPQSFAGGAIYIPEEEIYFHSTEGRGPESYLKDLPMRLDMGHIQLSKAHRT